jgi:hypothetical protein
MHGVRAHEVAGSRHCTTLRSMQRTSRRALLPSVLRNNKSAIEGGLESALGQLRAALATCRSEARQATSLDGTKPSSTGGQTTRERQVLLSLERSLGGPDKMAADDALRATGAFHAEVYPDLPIATTWRNLWRAMT